MKTPSVCVIATLFWVACGSGGEAEPDAGIAPDAVASDDGSPVADVPQPTDQAQVTWPEADALPDGSADAGSDTLPGGEDAAALVCDPERLAASPPALQAQTGCFVPGAPGIPTAEFFPYEVNSPLWSDGAVKARFLRLPPGTTIKVKDCDLDPSACLPLEQGGTPEDEGHFDLPVGSILVKNFSLQGTLLETRLLVHASATIWKGYSYEWDPAVTTAHLLEDAKDRVVGAQVWHYPSGQECLQCHTAAAGRSLGPTSRQLDRDTPEGNQLDRMVARGLLAVRPKRLAPYPDPRLAGPVEDRARSYLQSNCSFCHRPGGPFSDMDLRYATSLLDTQLCDVPILRGSGDPALPPLRLVPGKPAESNLSFRMHNRDGYPMPKIGSNVVDPVGAALVDQWISGITSCPASP